MSSTLSHRRGAGVAAAALSALLLTACGAGQNAETYREQTVADSTNIDIGTVAVRGMQVLPPSSGTVYAAGAEARAVLTMINNSGAPDQLVGVASDAAAAVQVVGPTGAPETAPVSLPAGVPVTDRALLLKGLTRQVMPGEYVTIELAFANAGRQSLRVPVELTGTPAPQRSGYTIPETDSAGHPVVEPQQK